MITPWRHDLIERLLGILLESIPFELPVEVRCLLLEEPSGSWVFPSPISTLRLQSQWINASLHWMWQEETSTCCLNFLANEGHLPLGVILKKFQWTLEASHPCASQNSFSPFSINATPVVSDLPWTHGNNSGETECRRYEPSTAASTSCDTAIIPVKTFWKIGVLQTLCIEWRVLTLMGTLESWILFLLSPQATFSCDQILWHDPPSSTSTAGTSRSFQSQEHVRLAHFLQYLESFPTPHLQWKTPPPTSTTGTTTTTTSFHSLADLFRFAYTWLEDQQPKSRSTTSHDKPTATTTIKDTPSETSRILPGSINVKKSIGDSLAISGGLAATGASFISPIGVAVSVAAVGVNDGITMAANKGKETRHGDGYRFGDVARGVMATLKEQRAGKATRYPDDHDNYDHPGGTSSTVGGSGTTDSRSNDIHHHDGLQETKSSIKTQPSETQDHKARYAGIVGSSIGAAAGLALAGPIGFVAGSLIGGTTTQQAMMQRRKDEALPDQQQQDRPSQGEPCNFPLDASGSNYGMAPQDATDMNNNSAISTESKPWRFGDNVRNAVQRGKEVAGRDSTSEYQFGDLTRGLFSRRK